MDCALKTLFPNRLLKSLPHKIEIMSYVIVRTLRHSMHVYLVQKHGSHSHKWMSKEGEGRESGRATVYSL